MKQILSFFTALSLTIALFTFCYAQDSVHVTLRIEGKAQNLYYNNVYMPVNDINNVTLKDILSYVDAQEDLLSITGLNNNYITDINGDFAGSFGGWDGWLFRINSTEPEQGIGEQLISDGDNIVVYFGDPYGIGMQYPEVNCDRIKEGILRFTSKDTVYDSNYNPSVSVNPVKGMTVRWFSGSTATEYVTNENGEITIEPQYLCEGLHPITINKTSANGCPLVLRTAPDCCVTVPPVIASTDTENGLVLLSGKYTAKRLSDSFINSDCKIFDNDRQLSDDEAVFTGTALRLYDGNNLLREFTVAVPGDVDGTAGISIDDARLVLRFSVKLETPSKAQFAASKVTESGDNISVNDARLILRAAVGLEII